MKKKVYQSPTVEEFKVGSTPALLETSMTLQSLDQLEAGGDPIVG